jgi:ankyrin repeat protein
MVAWGRGGDGVDEVRLDEIGRELAVETLCDRGVAVVGFGIEGGSVAAIRRGVAEGGVDLNEALWCGRKSIEYAISCGDGDEVVSALIECGASANLGDGQHLRDAAKLGRARVCAALVRAGVDVNGIDQRGNTALHGAAEEGRLEVCELLVASGANVGAVNKHNMTAVGKAKVYGRGGVLAYLEGQR